MSSNFDTGNIELEKISGNRVDVRIRKDVFTKFTDNKAHSQWFHFKISNLKSVQDQDVIVAITNAGECSYPSAFEGYWVCASSSPSYKGDWFRLETKFVERKSLEFKIPSGSPNTLWIAYFTPYTIQDHQTLIGRMQTNPLVRSCFSLGHTLQGRDMDLIQIGNGKNKVWLIGRQHPGETQPSFWMEGVLDRLTSKSDPVASKLRTSCTFYVVPLMCPDGAALGHLRTNASGANLNREWDSLKDKDTGKIRYEAPTLERSPEVYYVLKEMDRIGVDMALDVHGDEELPHVFLAGGQGAKVWGPRLEMLFSALAINYSKSCPDFGQLEFGYGNDASRMTRYNVASSQLTQRFDCLAATLEMPYKDSFAWPDPARGFTACRCNRLGAAFLDALAPLIPILRVSKEKVKEATGDMFVKGTPAFAKEGYKAPVHKELKWRE